MTQKYENPTVCGVFAWEWNYLQFGNNSIFSDCTGNGELTYDLVIFITDDEGRTDVGLLILEIYVLAKMISGELFAVYYVPVVIADDQPEFFSGGVFEIHMEYYMIFVDAYVLNGDLLVGELGLVVLAAISQADDGIGDDKHECCCRDCF